MEFASIILGFLAVTVGVRGDTWNKHKSGIKRVTTPGWMALSIALLSALIAWHGIHERIKARKIIQTHSRLYVKAALADMLGPFWILHTEYSMSRGQIDTTHTYRASGLRGGFDLLRSLTPVSKLRESGFIKYLQTKDLHELKPRNFRYLPPTDCTKTNRDYPSPLDSGSASVASGIERIRTLLAIFSNELDVSMRSALLIIIDPDGFAQTLLNRKNTQFISSTMLPKSEPLLLNYNRFIDACAQISDLLPKESE